MSVFHPEPVPLEYGRCSRGRSETETASPKWRSAPARHAPKNRWTNTVRKLPSNIELWGDRGDGAVQTNGQNSKFREDSNENRRRARTGGACSTQSSGPRARRRERRTFCCMLLRGAVMKMGAEPLYLKCPPGSRPHCGWTIGTGLPSYRWNCNPTGADLRRWLQAQRTPQRSLSHMPGHHQWVCQGTITLPSHAQPRPSCIPVASTVASQLRPSCVPVFLCFSYI